jgi:hypothetical protein
LGCALDLVRIRHVHGNARCRNAERPQFRAGVVQAILAARQDRHAIAMPAEGEGGGAAHARGPAGDDDDARFSHR